MKRLILFLLLAVGAFAQTAGSAQATFFGPVSAGAGTGDVTGPASSTDNAWALWNGATGKILKNSDVTYATPVLSVPDAFNISSAGSIALTAGGTSNALVKVGSPAVTVASRYQGFQLVGGTDVRAAITVDATGTQQPVYTARRARGTPSLPTAVQSGDNLLQLWGEGYGATAYQNGRTGFTLQADDNWTDSVAGSKIIFTVNLKGGTTSINSVGINSDGSLSSGGNRTIAAWGVSGPLYRSLAATVTDSSSPTGTVATAVFNSFAIPTINATNASVVYTNLANVYIAGDVATTGNASSTNSYGLWNVGKTRLDAPIVRTPSTLTYASPTSVNVALASFYTVTTVNATGSVTFNATAAGTSGQMLSITILNDATSAKTITFGTNFTANGTLTASGVSKKTTIQFISDGTAFIEVSRVVLP